MQASNFDDFNAADARRALAQMPLHRILPRPTKISVKSYIERTPVPRLHFVPRKEKSKHKKSPRKQKAIQKKATSLPPIHHSLSPVSFRKKKNKVKQRRQTLLSSAAGSLKAVRMWSQLKDLESTSPRQLLNEHEFSKRSTERNADDDFSNLSRPKVRSWLVNNKCPSGGFTQRFDPGKMNKKMLETIDQFKELNSLHESISKSSKRNGSKKVLLLTPYSTQEQKRREARELEDAVAYLYERMPSATHNAVNMTLKQNTRKVKSPTNLASPSSRVHRAAVASATRLSLSPVSHKSRSPIVQNKPQEDDWVRCDENNYNFFHKKLNVIRKSQ